MAVKSSVHKMTWCVCYLNLIRFFSSGKCPTIDACISQLVLKVQEDMNDMGVFFILKSILGMVADTATVVPNYFKNLTNLTNLTKFYWHLGSWLSSVINSHARCVVKKLVKNHNAIQRKPGYETGFETCYLRIGLFYSDSDLIQYNLYFITIG